MTIKRFMKFENGQCINENNNPIPENEPKSIKFNFSNIFNSFNITPLYIMKIVVVIYNRIPKGVKL